jgi:hypothetical protein
MAKAELSGAMVQPKQEKKYGQAKKSACFNIKNDVQSKSKVKRAIVPIHNEAKMTKRSQAIEIMKANTDKDMATVVKLIATKINVTEANAKSYYRYIVANGLAEGVVETTKRTAKTKKVPAAKMLTDLGLNKKGKFTGKVKAEVAKSADEIAKIKEANLERMKQVSAKLSKVRGYLPGQVAAPEADTPADFDPQLAREEVAAMIAEIDRERSSMVARKTAHE